MYKKEEKFAVAKHQALYQHCRSKPNSSDTKVDALWCQDFGGKIVTRREALENIAEVLKLLGYKPHPITISRQFSHWRRNGLLVPLDM